MRLGIRSCTGLFLASLLGGLPALGDGPYRCVENPQGRIVKIFDEREQLVRFAEGGFSPAGRCVDPVPAVVNDLQRTSGPGRIEFRAENSGEPSVEFDWRAGSMAAPATQSTSGSWEMFQRDSSHTGYVPISLDPGQFSLRWQRQVGSGYALNPVTAADGKVFVSLLIYFNNTDSFFVLDAMDGETLWSKSFGSVFSVNPPSYGYGNVYIQTGNHGSDTYLHAYVAETGEEVFQSPHSAQWERYYAPTIYDGAVYVNGGYYGGMYAFDAFSGQQLWFHSLPQYDDWTPAVDANLAYAYVGEYNPGLYAVNRLSGETAFMIPDPNFSWNGWSMDLAPVLGGYDDAVAIHDGRLIRFDLDSQTIGWELQRNFKGQPSIAHDAIYAVENGGLTVVDEQSGADLWSWQPPVGALSGPLIVTDTHVLASTGDAVYAVEILSHFDEWSFPAAGYLALGDETLYIASSNGTLTAISLPEYIPANLVDLEITGPDEVVENSTASYTALAYYDNGVVKDRTQLTEWSVHPDTYASIDTNGALTTQELLVPSDSVVVRGMYSEGDVSVEDGLDVTLVIGVTIEEFLARNINGALDIERQVLDELELALAKKRAAWDVMTDPDGGGVEGDPPIEELDAAIQWGQKGSADIESSVMALIEALQVLAGDGGD